MSVFGTNPVHALAGLGAAQQQAAKDAQKKSGTPDVPRQVTRVDDSVEFEDAAKHATSEDGGKKRRQQHEQQREKQAQKQAQKDAPGLDVQG
jgi:hypothetical protein